MGAVTAVGMPAGAVGNGPGTGNGSIQTSILHTYASLTDYLKTQDAKQEAMRLEVIGQTVKGRDIHMAKYISNPENPTILFLTQRHGNEATDNGRSLGVYQTPWHREIKRSPKRCQYSRHPNA